MARTNIKATRRKPASARLLTLTVLRRERISPHFSRVTLGEGDIESFTPMGFDQWFRLFIPAPGGSLDRLPSNLDNTRAYLRYYLSISKATRPLLRNYTVRAWRPTGAHGPELDVDFVLHGTATNGSAGATDAHASGAGSAAAWAANCSVGDSVAIFDEGITFTPPPPTEQSWLVADETGLPAVAGILASLPPQARGRALIEIPSEADRQELQAPAGIEVSWIARTDPTATPGVAALAAARAWPLPTEPFYGWVVGEQKLASEMRRHWVRSGIPKNNITFCGYWRTHHA